jgi:hypothetical protein
MREKLIATRRALLQLHKSILEYERAAYERSNGRVESPHAMLQLVMHDPWFGWFRPLSEILVRIDEILDVGTTPADRAAAEAGTVLAPDDADANALLRELRSLLLPAEQGEEFAVKYHAMLQQDPEVILAHAKMAQLLG